MKQTRNPFTGELEDHPPPQTFLCPPESSPTRETVSKALGLNAPHALVELAQQIYCEAKGDPYRCAELFGESVGIGAASGPTIYDSAPCELFPIGYPGVDGVHFGYLVHAPELDAEDHPICHFCPMDSYGVSVEGIDTCNGIASIMRLWGTASIYPNTSEWTSAVERHRKTEAKSIPIEDAIEIPIDWRFEPTADGIGVLAPSSLFGPKGFIAIDPYGTVESFARAASESLHDGYLATALYYLRDGYWHNWHKKPLSLSELLCEVYERLNRPSLANVMRARIANWRNQA